MKKFILLLFLMMASTAFAGNEAKISVPVPEIKLTTNNYFPITSTFSQALLDDFVEKLSTFEGKELIIYFDSPGGSVFAMSRMIGMMKSSGIKTTCVARFAASAAFNLFENCTNRYLLYDGILMSHHWAGGFRDEGPRIKSLYDVIDSIVKKVDKNAYTRMNLPADKYYALLSNNLWMDTELAKKYNAIDGVALKISCSKSLVKKRVKQTISGFFSSYSVYRSGCPLISKVYPKPKYEYEVKYTRKYDEFTQLRDKIGTHAITGKLRGMLNAKKSK